MFALRFGSYSIAATFAGTPDLSRRKSTIRYCFLCPPPRCQTTISPWLFRPPERFLGSSRLFSGVCLVIWLLSTTVMNRRDAVYGLKLLSPISASYLLNLSATAAAKLYSSKLLRLQILRVLDHFFAFGQFYVSLLPVAAEAHVLSPAAHLAVKNCGAHIGHFHFEDLLHRFLDLRLGRLRRHFKNHRVLRFLHAQTLFRNDRAANHLIVRGCHGLLLPLFACRLLACRRLFLCCWLLGFARRLGFVLGRRFRFRSLLRCWGRSNRFHLGRVLVVFR